MRKTVILYIIKHLVCTTRGVLFSEVRRFSHVHLSTLNFIAQYNINNWFYLILDTHKLR